MAGGQRTETTREEAPWLRSPNPKTGIAPRVPALLGHPQAEAPRSSPPGFSPFAPDRSCLQAEAMFLAVELMLMLTLQPDQDLGETETEVERESQDTT